MTGGSLWAAGLALSGSGTILGAVTVVTTIVCLRAPGTTLWRMPIFTWNALAVYAEQTPRPVGTGDAA